MGRLTENSVLNLKNKSHAVTAEIDVPEGGADGVIIAQGGAFAGWSLYLHGRASRRTATTCSASSGSRSRRARRSPPGTHQVRMEFAYDGGGLGKGGTVTLYVDGDRSARAGSTATVPMVFSADETCDVGRGHGLAGQRRLPGRTASSPARSTGCSSTSARTPDHDHLITPEERLRVAMARQ